MSAEETKKRDRAVEGAGGGGQDKENDAPLKVSRLEEEDNVYRKDDSGINPEYMKIYYDRLFPVSLMYQWLGYGNQDTIKKREFSFTLKDDVYIRYCSFKSKDELKQGLMSKVPYKIDIGAVFNAAPNLHDSIPSFKPMSKEFVVDIDMTDYDDVRTCCSGADICIRCWPLMTAALRVVEHALSTDFGFKHMLWVYSGRRGVHCWVCDKAARDMSQQARTAVIDYLAVYMGNDQQKLPEIKHPIHPSLLTAYDTLMPYFLELVESQELLDEEEGRVKFLGASCHHHHHHQHNIIIEYLRIDDPEDLEYFKWSDKELQTDAAGMWNTLEKKINKKIATSKRGSSVYEGLKTALVSIVFMHCYPRLDVNVSKQLNHLLKSPFCVHPKTGRVCVPIDTKSADKFNPFEVPTLNGLFRELNAVPVDNAASKTKSWMQTSMRPHILYFQNFVKDVLEEERSHAAMSARANDMEDMEVDW